MDSVELLVQIADSGGGVDKAAAYQRIVASCYAGANDTGGHP
jgi:hypothetical protein